MIARGAKGNPWIFHQIKEYYRTGKIIAKPELDEVIDIILRQAKLAIEYKGEHTAMHQMRKHVGWYVSGYPNASKLKNKTSYIETYDDLEDLLKKYLLSTWKYDYKYL